MSLREIQIPDIGDVESVEVIELSVVQGDKVSVDDTLLVLESDKASMEIPSPCAGVIKEIKMSLGDSVSEGSVFATIEEEGVEKKSDENTGSVENVEIEQPTDASEMSQEDIVKDIEETIYVPDIGTESAEVIEVSIAEGDVIEAEATVIVLETDKASMEVPSPQAGTVVKILLNVGDKVSEGSKIALMNVSSVEEKQKNTPEKVKDTAVPVVNSVTEVKSKKLEVIKTEKSSADKLVHAGPAVRKLAREFGVDLSLVEATGPRGRIVKEDLHKYVQYQLKKEHPAGVGLPVMPEVDFSKFGEVDAQPMSRIQKLTAENMQRSWLNVPHVTQFDEADISDLDSFRKQQKSFAEAKGIKLTPMPFIIKAVALALKEYPQFNVSVDMQTFNMIHKKYINIGIAVDTPDGLVVPVIRDADKKGIWGLAEDLMAIADRAKHKRLTMDEMQGGCFTISSLGGIGGTAFTPIVNAPEVAILGVSKAQHKPVYQGEEFVPRLMLPLSLSYDHRAVNGADAARFTSYICYLLGDLRHMML